MDIELLTRILKVSVWVIVVWYGVKLARPQTTIIACLAIMINSLYVFGYPEAADIISPLASCGIAYLLIDRIKTINRLHKTQRH